MILDNDVVFTTGQIAKICEVAPRTVGKWFDSGELKGFRIPYSQDRRIPGNNLETFLKKNGMPLDNFLDFLIDKENKIEPEYVVDFIDRNVKNMSKIKSLRYVYNNREHIPIDDISKYVSNCEKAGEDTESWAFSYLTRYIEERLEKAK